MHNVWDWVKFWWRCFEMGFLSFNSTFSLVKNCVGILAAALFFLKKPKEKQSNWDKTAIAVTFWVCVLLSVFYTIGVAPYRQYHTEFQAHQNQNDDATMEKLRPKLESTLFIDNIPAGSNTVNYHFEITNIGEVTAFAQEDVWLHGKSHSHHRPGDELIHNLNVIDAHGGKVNFSPQDAWGWETNDETLNLELRLTYWFVLNGKEECLRAKHTFRIDRDTIHVGAYNPNHSSLSEKPDDAQDIVDDFLDERDGQGDVLFAIRGVIPHVAASNTVRQLYIDDKTNLIRFYFQTPSGKSIKLTNQYVISGGVTNVIIFSWDSHGAMLAVDGQVEAEPPDYWEQVMTNAGAKVIHQRTPR